MTQLEPERVVGDVVVLKGSVHRNVLQTIQRGVARGGEVVVVRARYRDDIELQEIFEELVALRLLLDGVPRIHSVWQDGEGVAAVVEEDAGVVTLIELVDALTAQQGQVSADVAVAMARACALPFVSNERRRQRAQMELQPHDVVFSFLGAIRALPAPYPRWDVMSHGAMVINVELRMTRSPEEIRGDLVEERGPMYAFGVLLWQVLTGRHPFADTLGESHLALLRAIVDRDVPPVRSVRHDVPPALAAVVDACCARAVELRPRSWLDVEAGVDAAASSAGTADGPTLAGLLAGLFPERQRADALLREQAALLDVDGLLRSLPGVPLRRASVTRPVPAPERETTRNDVIVADGWSADGRPLWRVPDSTTFIDARPVSHAAWCRFCLATGRPPLPIWQGLTPPPDLEEQPVTGVTLDDAWFFSVWCNMSLPTEEQWQQAVDALGASLAVGRVWEWTTTKHRGGFVVRGGPWRNRPGPGRAQNRSWEDEGAADVSFRCVGPAASTR